MLSTRAALLRRTALTLRWKTAPHRVSKQDHCSVDRVNTKTACDYLRWQQRSLLSPSYSSTTSLALWLVSNSSLTTTYSAYQVFSKLDLHDLSSTRAAGALLLKTASRNKTIARSIESIRKLLYRVRVFVICWRILRWRNISSPYSFVFEHHISTLWLVSDSVTTTFPAYSFVFEHHISSVVTCL